jgi:deoxyadenosine/deoxycytidine kinase
MPAEGSARPRIISLEGNIGVGKSTLLRALRGNFQTVDEPLDKWRGEGASGEARTNLLELFYRDPQRWAFTFQSAAFLSRAQMASDALQSADPQSTFILERSIQSDKYCFAMNCLKTNLFSTAEWNVYDDFHSW